MPGARVLSDTPGRLRVHLPAWSGHHSRSLERQLRGALGVRRVQANAFTANVLIQYDVDRTGLDALLSAANALTLPRRTGTNPPEPPSLPPLRQERLGDRQRARIAVRGLDRNLVLAREVEQRLERYRTVRARASPLSGRVLVEWSSDEVSLEEILDDLDPLQDLPLPGTVEAWPADPADPADAVLGSTRLAGAALALSLVSARRALARAGPLVVRPGPALAAELVTLLYAFPTLRSGLRRAFGASAADFAVGMASIVALVLAGKTLGLVLAAAEALRLVPAALARRDAWRRFEERHERRPAALPAKLVQLEPGDRPPLSGEVIEGAGSAIGADGLPIAVAPGTIVPAGAVLHGGAFTLRLRASETQQPETRPGTVAPNLLQRYLQVAGGASLVYAAFIGLTTRSLAQTCAALLMVNARTALVGGQAASVAASARVLRSGVTVSGTRPARTVRLPTMLVLEAPRLLADGLELESALPLSEGEDPASVTARAAAVAAEAGAPWGKAFEPAVTAGGRRAYRACDGSFEAGVASAEIDGVRYLLSECREWRAIPVASGLVDRGNWLLLLRQEGAAAPLGIVTLRPSLAAGVHDLVDGCRRRGVELAVLQAGDAVATQALARRAGIALIDDRDAVGVIRAKQERGAHVAFVADHAEAGAAFAACDLAIALTGGAIDFPARADLLAPDLAAVAAIVEAGARREATNLDAVALSAAANLFGVGWGLSPYRDRGRPMAAVHLGALAALASSWVRLGGGRPSVGALSRIADPRPERWGRYRIEEVLELLDTSEAGLRSARAREREHAAVPGVQRKRLATVIADQLRSPLVATLAAGAALSILHGSGVDALLIGATIAVNVGLGAWQERHTGQAAAALERMGDVTATVLRDGEPVRLPAPALVPGDVLVLAPGDRVAADARLISSHNLEVDESVLTGESLPVAKQATNGDAFARVVLEGSDVTSGTANAVVFAVGRDTRMGATAAALAASEEEDEDSSPLSQRLHTMLNQVLPWAAAGGALVTGSGILQGRGLPRQLAIGASVALAALPEGLPLLAKMGEAAVARRLAGRHAVVRRLSAVEALGRVDVACTDKTGTLTEGRLRLRLIADLEDEVHLPRRVTKDHRHALLTAALASPHPDAADASLQPTDSAVVEAAEQARLGKHVRAERTGELAFEAARGYHAVVAQGRLCLKGAPEVLIDRCRSIRRAGADEPLDAAGRNALLRRADELAERGLRVLLVAEGPVETPADEPDELTALGLLGIMDPLRRGVAKAVQRCQRAGVRVIMITGDHPSTALSVAQEAGILAREGEMLTGAEIAELGDDELDHRLEHATVVARATPLDKLRIVESLKRLGHCVAMTGDGVNDAPALRLADVGVAMGAMGTEVASQAADVVLTDDNFASLVETLVEGRTFWGNIRRALGLLLGGNLGEIGMMAIPSLVRRPSPLSTRQVLAVNMITDALPALAVTLQGPEHRNLAALSREGTAALGRRLQHDIARRAIATQVPSLAAYFVASRAGDVQQARSVAFAGIVATQLSQTYEMLRAISSLSRASVGAMLGAAGLLVTTLTLAPIRALLDLTRLLPGSWLLAALAALAAVPLNQLLALPTVPFTTVANPLAAAPA